MSWNTQARTLEVSCEAFPTYRGEPVFVATRLAGTEKLGRLYDYEVDVSTIEADGLYISELHKLVDVNKLVGKRMTVRIAIGGNGTWQNGLTLDSGVNFGADIREITGVITEASCLGAEAPRRMFYRFRLRPALWLTSLNRENRAFMDKDVVEITREVLKKYPIEVRYRLSGPGGQKSYYPKRDYTRQWFESDWNFLDRLWQEFGVTFFQQGDALVLFDNASWKKHGPAYRTILYLDRGGQRIDEEHVHTLKLSRALTTGQTTVTDYDYMQGESHRTYTVKMHRDASHDNAEEYIQADYAQPLQGAMGVNGQRNDEQYEARLLARVRVDAHRCKSMRIKGEGNLRGLMTGYSFFLEGYPYQPANAEYVVTGTTIEIVNNDTVTQGGGLKRQYTCKTKFTAQDANEVYRTPLKAKKPRAFAETAIVCGYDNSVVTTDPLARLRLWFTWDRKGQRDGQATCWVPLAQPWQGTRRGAIWIPRVDDHVHVGYYNSDPDRPFILASHTTNDNKTPWDLPANEALSGWRSQDIGRKSGSASNSVVTDDTPGRLQVQVTSDHANSRFVAGFNTRIDGNKGRTEARGEGIEVATDAHAVMRANKGTLITTEPRSGATAPALDRGETVQRLAQAAEQHDVLAAAAVQAGAQQSQDRHELGQPLKQQATEIGRTGDDGLGGPSEPHLVLASAADVAATATGSTHLHSGRHTALTSGEHTSVSTGGNLFASARKAIRLFAYQLGIRIIAYAEDINISSLKKNLNLLAKLDITQSANRITIKATEEVMLHGGDSYISLRSGKITVGGGVYEVNAQANNLPPKPMGVNANGLPDVQANDQLFRVLSPTGQPLPGVDYQMIAQSAGHIFRTDELGRSPALNTVEQESAAFQLHWDEFSAARGEVNA
ncbi:type VI secretion system Vgr family protein [Paraburkholderia caledonica]|uniref:Type VI secretion system secreted protein VgrG n=1 Tax=Paraburkholderia caledonica TaxID=134536 RepID=A0AB73IG76_9BURK|nr:type VI secretion system secreted protein VgrG [Paraburkholderia caledonica]